MRVMDELTESHKRMPSVHHAGAQSPRVGGCVGAFFHMFDWNSSKHFSSTKRITADRPNHESLYSRRDRSFTERTHTATSKVSLITEGTDETFSTLKHMPTHNSTASQSSVKSDDIGKRVPGLVARLMGLESMPDITYSSTKSENQDGNHAEMPAPEQLDSPPVLLQELLRQEFHQHCKRSLKDKLPGFTKKQVDLKPVRGTVSQMKKPRGYFGEHAHPHSGSRSPRPARPSEKKTSFIQEGNKALVKRPFLARLQTGAPTLQPSKSQNSNSSPLLSPSMLGGKNTVRLLETAVKVLEPSIQPSPRSRYALTRETHRDTQSDSGGSFRSEKRSFASSHGRGGSPANSSSRSLRSQSISRTWSGRDDRAEHSGHESSRQDQTSRRRFEKGLVTSTRSVSPLQTHRSRISNSKIVEGSPQSVLGTHEASIRGFKIDLGNQGDSPQKMTLEKQEFDSQSVEFEALSENHSLTSSWDVGTDIYVESLEPGNCDQNADVNAVISQGSPSISKSVTEKPASSGGCRSIRFRSRSGKQEKDVGGLGNRVFPSDNHAMEKSVGLSLPKEAKVAGAGFSYSMLFSSKKQGDKKEGGDKGEVLKMKRTDSSLMRSFLRRPGSSPGPTTKSGSQCSEKKSRIVEDNDVDVEKVEPSEGVACQDSSLCKVALEEPELSPTHTQLEKTKDMSFVQARYRSIDDVFPELPLEENDIGGASPDLGKTIQALEEQFLGFGSQGEPASLDCRSIERMFGKGFSRSYVPASPTSPDFSPLENLAPETSPTSPEAFVTECVVPGTFPNSPSQKYEKIFSSRSHLNLQDMFEVISGDCPHDLAGRRRSFCLSEPRERVLDDEEAGADLDTCSNSAVCDTGGTPDRLEIQKMSVAAGWSEDVVTPPALKKFEEKLAQGFSDSDDSHTLCAEESGQPSPVSVLYSPFLDEVPTTPDASFAESQQTDKDLNDIDDIKHSHIEDDEEQNEETQVNMPTSKVSQAVMPEIIETCMIKQAILDISRFRNIDISSIGLEPPNIAVEPQQEQNYIREVLDAANLLREGESGWYSAVSPMNKSLFDRLEFGSIKLDERILMESKRWGALPDAPRQGSGIRSERKLLFDCVNEVMALEPWMKTTSFFVDLPMFPNLHLNSKFRSLISGEPLVKEVYRMICHWRDIAGNVLDDLIDYDMNVPEGRWVDFSHEVADVGLYIERTLLKNMIGEIVDDLASILTARALSTP